MNNHSSSSSSFSSSFSSHSSTSFVRPHSSADFVVDTTGVEQSAHDVSLGIVPEDVEVRKRRREIEEEDKSKVDGVDLKAQVQLAVREVLGAEEDNTSSHPHKRIHTLTEGAHEFFARTRLTELLKDRPRRALVLLEHNATVANALQTLARENILSAPVVLAASAEDSESDVYLGIFDALTLLRRVYSEMASTLPKDVSADECDRKLEQLLAAYGPKLLVTVCSEDDVDFVPRGLEGQNLHELVSNAFFRIPRHPVHRVAVFSADGRVRHVISQSDVVRFIVKHIDQLGVLKDEPVESFGWASAHVLCVLEETRASEAFRQMILHGVSSVGITRAKDGAVVGNLSASDLRGLQTKDFVRFASSAINFISQPPRVFTCKKYHTLEHLLRMLVDTHVHRVYIVDEHQRPTGIVTLTDILRLVMRL